MKAVAHTLACSHLPLSGPMDRIKALPSSSMKTFLPPSRHMKPITITHRSIMKSLAAVDEKHGDSVYAPTPAGHREWPPLDSFDEYLEYLEKENLLHIPLISESELFNSVEEENVCDNCCALHEIEKTRRKGRQANAEMFRIRYTYGSVKDGCNNSKEQKTCIWPGDTLSWQDESSGIMWVGVYGRNSICVVTRNEDPDETRLHDILKKSPKDEVLFRFMESVIVEIEDLADPSSKIRERFDMTIKKPFGVVSVIPDAYKSRKGSGHEASSVEYGETKAIEFLQEKVKNRRVFTVTGTIQTAIAAFQELFQKKLKADEIKVSVVDPYYIFFVKDAHGRNPCVESLTIPQINEHLAVINKPGSKDSRTLREQYYASALSVSSRR